MRKSIMLLVIIGTVSLPNSLFGQKGTLTANTGFGLLQGYLIGFNYNYSQNLNAGVDIGSHLGLASKLVETQFSISIENNLQFGKENRFGYKPWYFGQQIMYWVKDLSYATVKSLSITPTLGIMLAFSKSLGLSLELGPAINFTLDIQRKTPEAMIYDWPIFPSGRVQLVYVF
jgi:hypothetical protein